MLTVFLAAGLGTARRRLEEIYWVYSAPEGVGLSMWTRSKKQSWRERSLMPVLKAGARAHLSTEYSKRSV